MAASAPAFLACLVRSIASSVEFEPVPAITGTPLPLAARMQMSITRLCSSIDSVGDSPVVPQGTRPSVPSLLCQAAPAPAQANAPPNANASSGGQLPIGNGAGLIPADSPSEVAKEISTGKPLASGEAAALAAAFKAIDDSRWADARAAVANFNNPLLKRIVDWHILRVAPKTDADFASTWRML